METVKAIDGDSGDFGTVFYSLKGGNDVFAIDSDSVRDALEICPGNVSKLSNLDNPGISSEFYGDDHKVTNNAFILKNLLLSTCFNFDEFFFLFSIFYSLPRDRSL